VNFYGYVQHCCNSPLFLRRLVAQSVCVIVCLRLFSIANMGILLFPLSLHMCVYVCVCVCSTMINMDYISHVDLEIVFLFYNIILKCL
jgi:hypothetical protein